MRVIAIVVILVAVLVPAAACSSNQATDSTTPAASATPTLEAATTATRETTATASPTGTSTPRPSPEPTATPVVIEPPPLTWGPSAGYYPPGFLEYDPAHYVVHTRDLHGTMVEVAVNEDLTEGRLISGVPGMGPEAYSEWVFEIFEYYQRIFGGFPFDRYVVVVRGPSDDPIGYFITSEWGLEVGFAGWELDSTREHEPPHGFTWPFAQEWTAHEIFHAWNGQFIDWQPDDSGRLFQTETWLAEGATTYYSFRVRPDDLAFYREHMGDAAEEVQDAANEDGWLSFADMAKRVIGPGPNGEPPPYSPYNALMLQKGALVCYLLDGELRDRGSSLDEFMRRLYVDFGLEGVAYTEADLEALASELAGEDLGWFFDAYVTGAEPLPLDGTIEFLP